MKKVEFQGAEFEVPDWARWIAQDQDGSIYVYENIPMQGNGFYCSSGGKFENVLLTNAPMLIEEIK